jgi:hypothetical protein
MKKKLIIMGGVLTFLFTGVVFADNKDVFFVEPSYDFQEREQLSAVLKQETEHTYFYIEEQWWEDLYEEEQEETTDILKELGKEFEEHIFPETSSFLGDMPKHKVVGEEERVVVLFHQMQETSGGYFRTGDQYSAYQYPHSNEKNIIYVNADLIKDINLKSYLAHEYTHLVTFNEKNKRQRVNEEVWLNELRAEIMISLLGYNDVYEGSNLEIRVNSFLHDPDFSLTDWTDQGPDYGVINLFGHYLIDHYGEEVLSRSLKSSFVGIPSIDFALWEGGYDKKFKDVFKDWVIAVYLNDCSYGEQYCYKNENLKDVNVSHSNIFISTQNGGSFSLEYKTKNWAGNWHRIIGGEGVLYLDFQSEKDFIIPYIICEKEGACEIKEIQENEEGERKIKVEEFNSMYESLTIIPFLGERVVGFNGPEESFSFMWEARISSPDRSERWIEVWEILGEIRTRIENLYNILGIEIKK